MTRSKTRRATLLIAAAAAAGLVLSSPHVTLAAGQPSIDDLLNLTPTPNPAPGSAPGNTPGSPAATPDSPDKTNVNINPDLVRKLSNQDSSEAFEAAVMQMDDVVKMLAQNRDASPLTQRTQQDILAKLDQVIATAKKQPQPPGSGDGEGDPDESQSDPSGSDKPSSSGDRGSQQNQSSSAPGSNSQNNQGKDPGNSQKIGPDGKPEGQQPGKPNGQNGNQSDPNNTTPGSATRTAADGSPLKSSRTEWGNLPPRVREQLLEGMSERFSPVYQEMTEAYYKRLGREGQP
jgi:hypothetical protein